MTTEQNIIVKALSLSEVLIEEVEKSSCDQLKETLYFFKERVSELSKEFNQSQIKTQTNGS